LINAWIINSCDNAWIINSFYFEYRSPIRLRKTLSIRSDMNILVPKSERIGFGSDLRTSTWHRDKWLSLFQFYRENFLTSRSVDTISNHHIFTLFHHWNFPKGEVHDLSGEVQKFSGEVQNDLRGGAHLSTPPLKIRPRCK
jgi:hypothetical protein